MANIPFRSFANAADFIHVAVPSSISLELDGGSCEITESNDGNVSVWL